MRKFSQTSLNLYLGLDVEQTRPGLMESEQSSDPIALDVEQSRAGLMESDQSSDLIALDGTETFLHFP